MDYLDNPLADKALIKSYTNKELNSFVCGYALALNHIKESVGGGKIELLNELLKMSDQDKPLFINYVALLDEVEERIDERMGLIKDLYPEYLR